MTTEAVEQDCRLRIKTFNEILLRLKGCEDYGTLSRLMFDGGFKFKKERFETLKKEFEDSLNLKLTAIENELAAL